MLTCLAVSQAGYGRRGGIGDGTISRAWPCPSFLRTGLNGNLSLAALDGKSQGPGRCSLNSLRSLVGVEKSLITEREMRCLEKSGGCFQESGIPSA